MMMKRITVVGSALLLIVAISFSQWTAVGLAGKDIYAITADAKNIVAGTGAQGVWRSTDNGTTWDSINNNIVDRGILTLYTNETMTIAGTAKGVCYTKTDSNFWQSAVAGLTTLFTRAIAMKGSAVFAGTEGGGFFSAPELGATWVQNNNGLMSTTVRVLLNQGTDLVAGTTNGVYRSTDDGAQWTTQSTGLMMSSALFIRALAISGSILLAGTRGGIYVSTGPTGTWTVANVGLIDTSVEALYVSGSTIYAGTSGGVYQSTDNGGNWSVMNTGYTNEVRCLIKKDNYLYAGTFGDGVYRYPVTASAVSDVHVPSSFAIEQNYPNPFNPLTQIEFSIPQSSHVTLKVYDVLGKEIATLVNSEKEIGTYTTTWNAQNCPSGVYFYRLTAGSYTLTKKLLLMR